MSDYVPAGAPCQRTGASACYLTRALRLGLLVLALSGGASTVAVAAAPAEAPDATVPPPPMGWASWNSFSNTVSAKVVMAQAKAMVANGMRDAGYHYVLIDEGWWLGERDAEGNIRVDPQQWPALADGEHAGDMSNIVRVLHGLGLKAGIYTDAGEYGCSYHYPDIGPPRPHTGSLGHYERDFEQFARWGFDYVKVDWCGGDKPNLDPAVQYGEIARAIRQAGEATGNTLFFSICDWGRQSPWTWGPGIGDLPRVMWRTGGDIVAPIVDVPQEAKRRVELKNVLSNFDAGVHPEAGHTGYSNDMDMMVLGMRGTTNGMDRIHMGLWAMGGSPMMQGADLTKLTPEQIKTVTNREVIAIDQDALGVQCIKVSEAAPGLQVWAKPLAGDGTRAVLLLNRTRKAAEISAVWESLGLRGWDAAVRDVWADKAVPSAGGRVGATVPANDAVLFVIEGKDMEARAYSPQKRAAARRSRGEMEHVVFDGVRSARPESYVRVLYRNRGSAPVVARLWVDGLGATRVQFPPTQGGRTEAITLEVPLKGAGAESRMEFEVGEGEGKELAIESVAVMPWNEATASSGLQGSQ